MVKVKSSRAGLWRPASAVIVANTRNRLCSAGNPLRSTDGALGNGHCLCSSAVAGAMVRVLDWTGLLTGLRPLGTWHRPSVAIELTGGPRWRLDIDGRWVEVDDGHSDALISADARTLAIWKYSATWLHYWPNIV